MDLIEKYSEPSAPPASAAVPVAKLAAQTAKRPVKPEASREVQIVPTPARLQGKKRPSTEMSHSDKENVHIHEDLNLPKKRAKTTAAAANTRATRTASRPIAPSTSPFKPTESMFKPPPSPPKSFLARPVSPIKPGGVVAAATASLASLVNQKATTAARPAAPSRTTSRATSRQAGVAAAPAATGAGRGKKRVGAAAEPVADGGRGRGSDGSTGSDDSAATTIVVKNKAPAAAGRKVAVTKTTTAAAGTGTAARGRAAANKKENVAPAAGGGRVLRARKYLLRRSALKALSSSSTSFVSKPRSITTLTSSTLRARQQWIACPLQRRFASDEAARPSEATVTDETVTESPSKPEAEAIEEHGSRTASEAPAQAAETSEGKSSTADTISSAAQTMKEKATETVESIAQSATGAAYAATGGLRSDQRSANKSQGVHVPESAKVLYVGNLFFEVSEEQLEREFSRFGPVTKTRIIYDNRGLSKGFGYVEFESEQDAARAIEQMNQQVFEGRRMTVQYHKRREQTRLDVPRQQAAPSKTLFIGNMSFEMSDKDLNNLFRDIRNVLDVRVAIDRRTGQPRGFAHADFIDVQSAQKAMEVLKNKEIYGRKLRVDFSHSSSQTRQQPSS
ncbi:hypothetical protein H2199_002642 [Coniosporium tulheliwenetii]|uniref:Uncharacterized protein n=1 Tax=Coniosporium tulheliwenetii TaxID=3383036 RepID=A0ACC2ZG43_9PEZI|nr:hypothetical protein H2199_002642 [Cladosporium sp. JES 115]